MSTRQRLVITLVLTAAVGLAIVAYLVADTDSEDAPAGTAIEALVPAQGAEILAQDRVGVDLAPGYTAALWVNGTPIPDDQLTIVDALNLVQFQPGPGKEFESWPGGPNCVEARYWLIADGPGDPRSFTWCFEAT